MINNNPISSNDSVAVMDSGPTSSVRLCQRILWIAVCVTGMLLALLGSGCSATSVATDKQDADAPRKVLLLGDSVAAGLAVPLKAALAASKVDFSSLAADGGGNVVGPFSDKNWPKLADQIDESDADVVVYQVTTYDWGTRSEQRAAYERLLHTVHATGARLIFVTMPPIRPDDFYRPHLSDLKRTSKVARDVAAHSSGQATVLDAGDVWGSSFRRIREGHPDRSRDGIHTCPQGAARFTDWMLGELHRLYPGFSPAPAAEWANSGWADDHRFTGC